MRPTLNIHTLVIRSTSVCSVVQITHSCAPHLLQQSPARPLLAVTVYSAREINERTAETP